MKRLVLIASCFVALSSLLISCGSKSSSPQAEQQRSELYVAMKGGDLVRVEAIADSMANEVGEDLSVDESVAVLIAYLQVHNNAAAQKNQDKDLETLRKFVDFYDLASRNKGEDLNKAFNSAKEINSQLDLAALVADYSNKLAEFDAGTANDDASAAKTVAPKEKKDEAKKDDAKKDDADKKDTKKDDKKEPKKDAPKKDAPKADQPVMPVD